MMTLLDYPKATFSHASSLRLGESANFSKRVWELHHVIANPHSCVVRAKSAKRHGRRQGQFGWFAGKVRAPID